jgi:2-methylcitrate dehydratase PrpD
MIANQLDSSQNVHTPVEPPSFGATNRLSTFVDFRGFTVRYPAELPSRVTVQLQNGESFTHEISDFAGAPTQPFTWEEIEAKFDKLTAGNATEESRQKVKSAVRSLEDIQVSDLLSLA